jgi:CubicO group peptidase (beta-lactamase class C family)
VIRSWLPVTVAVLACGSRVAPTPHPAPLNSDSMRRITDYLDSAVASGAAPGAVLAVLKGTERFVHGTGQLGADQPGTPDGNTIYDLASLTKVVGLTTAMMFAVNERKLQLDAPVQQYLPSFAGQGKNRVTVRMLLAHASGLPAWRPLFRETTTRAEVFALADTTPLDSAPGTAEVYSDLGAIVLTQLIETIYRERLDSLLQQRLFVPLHMSSTDFLPDSIEQDRIAPTEHDPWRGRVLRGEVHDENAARMDGVSGHAGLFASADDLLTFAEWMLQQAVGQSGGQAVTKSGYSSIIRPPDRPTVPLSVLREFTRRQNLVPGSSRALGWDTPSPGGSAGNRLSPTSFGHTGFTGTSLWIDPERHVAIILLSNRVNPTRDNPRWAPVRGKVADLVMTTLFEDSR